MFGIPRLDDHGRVFAEVGRRPDNFIGRGGGFSSKGRFEIGGSGDFLLQKGQKSASLRSVLLSPMIIPFFI